MDSDEYQWKALSTCMTFSSTREALEYCAHGLAGESGEVSEHIKKAFYHGHSLDKTVLKLEIGDLIWYAAVMAHKLGYTLSEIMESNLEKLSGRYPEGFSKEHSRNRDTYD
jgi:NTP pyrophosphatase (non-canonical NTP hydrolase)